MKFKGKVLLMWMAFFVTGTLSQDTSNVPSHGRASYASLGRPEATAAVAERTIENPTCNESIPPLSLNDKGVTFVYQYGSDQGKDSQKKKAEQCWFVLRAESENVKIVLNTAEMGGVQQGEKCDLNKPHVIVWEGEQNARKEQLAVICGFGGPVVSSKTNAVTLELLQTDAGPTGTFKVNYSFEQNGNTW